MAFGEVLPVLQAVHEAEMEILGVTLKCYVLNDGSRVIDADSFQQLMKVFFSEEVEVTEADSKRLAHFIMGAQ